MLNHQSSSINFFFEGIDSFPIPDQLLSEWILQSVFAEDAELESLNVIFCSDNFLLQINKEYLQHDYYTDIITFQYEKNPIQAELYISIDTVKDNAEHLGVSFENELFRVIIHGVLHCCGYTDASDKEKQTMRLKEDYYLQIWYADT